MIDISVTTYIQESSLLGHNLFPLTSNLFCLDLAQLLKTWFNFLAGLPPTGHISASYASSRSFAWLFLLPTLVVFEFRLIGVCATAFKGFWSQNCNRFLNFLKSTTASKGY